MEACEHPQDPGRSRLALLLCSPLDSYCWPLWELSMGLDGLRSDGVLLFSGSFVLLCFSRGKASSISKNEYKEGKKNPQGHEQILLTSKRFAVM